MVLRLNPSKLLLLFLLSSFATQASADEQKAGEENSSGSTVDLPDQGDKMVDDLGAPETHASAETVKEKVSLGVEKSTGDPTETAGPDVENDEAELEDKEANVENEGEENGEGEQNADDLSNIFGNMFGDSGLMEGLLAGGENGEANPLKDLMPLLKTFGDSLGKKMGDSEKGEKGEGEGQEQPDLGALLNMFNGLMNSQNKEEDQKKDEEGEPAGATPDSAAGPSNDKEPADLDATQSLSKEEEDKGEEKKTDGNGKKQETEPIIGVLKDFLQNNENVVDRIKEGLVGGEGKESLLKKVVETVGGQTTALDLVPYLFRDKLSDNLKNKLKEVTEADLLELRKVYADIENIESFEDIPKSIKKEAPKVYKASVDMYSQAQTLLAQFVSSLDKEPQNWISELIKDVKYLGEKHFNALVTMSMESHLNVQQAVTKVNPGLGDLLKRLATSKAAVFWIMNHLLQKEMNKMDDKKVPVADKNFDEKEL